MRLHRLAVPFLPAAVQADLRGGNAADPLWDYSRVAIEQRPSIAAAPAAHPALQAVLVRESLGVRHGSLTLTGSGLSPTDIIALTALRRRTLDGDRSESSTRAQRLEFARWLVQQGRLEG